VSRAIIVHDIDARRPGDQIPRFRKTGRSGYSPLYERLSALIAEDQQLLSILDDAPVHQRQPTLFFAAIHDLVLAHPNEGLARWYPTVRWVDTGR